MSRSRTRRWGRARRAGAALGMALAMVVGLSTPAFAGSGNPSLPVPEPLGPDARAEDAFDRDEARLRAQLLIDPAAPDRVGVLFSVDPGWHLYWKNPGDSGLATEIEWSLDGHALAEAPPIQWPTPFSFEESFEEGESLTTYGYGGQVLLSARLAAPLQAGQVLGAAVQALVCDDQCIPASLSLAARVPDGEPAGVSSRRARALFEAFATRVPVGADTLGATLEAHYAQHALRPGDRVEAGLLLRSCATGPRCVQLGLLEEPVSFFPADGDALRVRALGRRLARDDDAQALAFEIESLDDALPARLRGVIAVGDAEGERRGLRVDLPLPRADAGAAVEQRALPWIAVADAPGGGTTPPDASLSFAMVLWLAFVGGLILNLMPCVLPVLAIKVFSVADLAHRDRREVLAHGAAYTLGILVTMLALAAGVIALRSAGQSVGWGFQFQEPLFVAFVCTVVVMFALNLLGVFEIRFDPGRLAEVGAEAVGARRSFFEGLLAVVLATPCSAPFLGTAVGFAFSSTPLQIASVFAMIGLGLAAPYALVTAIPAWSRIIPRPGPWMVKLRAALGFLLLGSAVWLVWVFGRGAGLNAVSGLLAFLLAVAFLCWLYGNLPAERPRWMPAAIGFALLGISALGVNHVAIEAQAEPGGDGSAYGAVYDRDALGAELAAGRSVFSYFTADWCITCKVNERRVLAKPEVRAELERRDVAVFRGDWTQRDDAIRAELARYGKAGVPVYVVHHPNAPEEPLVLPELLTTDRLFAALRAAER